HRHLHSFPTRRSSDLPRKREFSYYPTPQMADQPKLEITREGAVWYCPRSGAEPGVGVLYPDMAKVKTLAAYYHEVDAIRSRAALDRKSTRLNSSHRTI